MTWQNPIGAVSLDYRGARFALGRTSDSYAIWDLPAGGPPVHTWPLTEDGWAQAWQTYQAWEAPSAVAQAAAAGPPALNTAGWTRGRPIPMQPMRVGEILDAAFKLFRLHVRSLVALSALVLVPLTVAQLLVLGATFGTFVTQTQTGLITPQDIDRIIGAFAVTVGIGAIVSFVATGFLTAAVVRGAADAYLGQEVAVGGMARAALRRLLSILWVLFLSGLVFVAAFLPFAGLVFLSVAGGAGGAGGLFFLLFLGGFALFLYLYVRLLFGPPALMVEDERGVSALRRSWRLSLGLGWKILGTRVLVFLLVFVISLAIQVPFQVIAGLAADGAAGVQGDPFGPLWFLQPVGSAVSQILVTPFSVLVTVLLYFDARIRKEGLDLAIMAQQMGGPPPPSA